MVTKVKKILFTCAYILIIIYLSIYIPSIWGFKPLVVASGSMEPVLKVGGILYYKENKLDNYKKDDILVYKTPNHIVSHRIVDINNGNFMTKGDANNTGDGIINKNQILGKGTNFCIPIIGYYADYVYHHKYLMVITLGLIIVDLINEKYKRKNIN